ncbi:ABC transporter A family member 1 [Citrus sinensis]|nr:ABC transporter A family member 1 [Citrus sinensis]
MGTAKRHLKAMLRKNWLLKVRHPFVTAAEILLPTVVMLLLIAVRTRVDTRIHPAQPYIRKDMFVEIGKGVSPNFVQALELMLAKGEYLAFAPDTEETRTMINLMSIKFPKLKLQQVLDSFIIFAAQQTGANVATENVEIPPSNLSGTHLSLKQPWTLYSPSNIRMVPFPTREYTDDEFQSIIKRVMGVLYLLGFLYPISRLISYSVFEKFAVSSGIITACTMDSLFKYSDKTVVFTYFFSFGLSAITLSFFISTFFARAKTAVAVGTLSFLGAFFPYYTVNDEAVPMVLKVIASLLSPTAFALGSVNFADYERAHVGLRWSNMWRASSGVNFLVCLLMMLLDTLLYGVIGLYLDKFHFDNFPRCIQIRKLHKVYATKRGNCCAVNSLQLTLYENQILALLGHNGAGKSTTISMLVGLIPPTTGDALVFGKNITADMDEIRKGLGVCPQYDILFPELTVREHLEMFAVLKGVKEELLERVVAEMVDEVGLADKVNIVVRALSGGMKRKLSLGIALIGDSKVVILDEPTSGMDPYSMRLTWQLIKKIKKGRIILLTTHSMDEAEELGDRIAIMANGSLKCCGSSLFLKHQYGVGYTLTLVKSAPDASAAADIVYRHIPSALCVSEVGTEITFKLPLASSSSFESMFREIESCIRKSVSKVEADATEDTDYLGIESFGISVTTLEEVFLRVAGCNLDESECISLRNNLVTLDYVSAESDDQAPKRISNSKLFGNYKWVFGFIVTVVQRACTLIVAAVLGFLNFLIKKCCTCCIISRSMFWQHCKALFIKRAVSARRDRKTIVFQLLIPAIFLLVGLLFLKLKPHPDMLSVTFTTSNFNPLLSGGGGGGPIPFDLSWPIANEVSKYIKGGWIQRFKQSSYRFPNAEKALADAVDAAGPTLGPVLLSMSEYLMSSFNESYQSRYGAIVMDDQNDDGSLGFTVLHNSSCQHAGPTFINVMNTAILRLATGNRNMTIRTRNHPLPTTQSQQLQRHDLDAFSVSIIISIAFAFIPASFAVAIVKEREVKAKQQQLISGVSVLSYWTSTYIWDFISFLFPSSCAIILFYIFGLDQFVGRDCLLPTVLIFLGYGLAIASSTYCLTFFFSDHTMAQNVVLLVHFFTGLILMVISFIMGLLETTRSANSLLKNFFRLSPGFCFADGLASLALLRQGMKDKTSDGVFDWNVTSASICYLGCESICYFLLTLGLELLPSHKWTLMTIKEWWKGTRHRLCNTPSSYLEPLLQSSSESDTLDLNEDIDVQVERNRVLSGSVDNAIIYLRNLRKVYPGGKRSDAKVAVHSLTFSVQAGECFGFLGTNGAGKTTTLSMISGEEYPTDGTAFIFGKDIRSDPKAARRLIGYCPQFDALLEYLTVQEHLELYARIKGVAEYRMDDVVMEKLVEFDLLKHAKKPSFTLSGGNKRKLSVAIAMIGDPPIVILDEPSTGMDPIAKRFMWEVISRLSTRQGKTAVILTTHSMNEAQALCTRIGIMVGGQLRCIGSPQHLKTRFGNFLELEVKPTEVSSVDLEDLCQIIQERVFDIPSQRRSLLDDLEVCIGGIDSISSENATAAEISLSQEMLLIVGCWLGNEERIKTLISSSSSPDRIFGEQLSEQLVRDGGIQLPIFSEWWLAKEKFAVIDSFILSSFPGSTFQGCNGLSVKYQVKGQQWYLVVLDEIKAILLRMQPLPFSEGLSVADVFGLLEQNRNRLGIAEYSISQSTLETIFNHFAANS